MTERDRASLLDIARFAETILQLTAGMDEAAFQADVRTQLAVLYELTVLGEAVKRLSQEFRDRHPEHSLEKYGRNARQANPRLRSVDARRVWEVVTTSLPALLNKIDPLLPKEGNA